MDRNVCTRKQRKKFTEEQIRTILSWVDAKRTSTLKELKDKAAAFYNIEISVKTMERYLKEFNYALLPSNMKCKKKTTYKLIWTKVQPPESDPLVTNNESTVLHDSIDNEEELTCNDMLDNCKEEEKEEDELYNDSNLSTTFTNDDNTDNNKNIKRKDPSKTNNDSEVLQLQREKLQISLLEEKRVNQRKLHAVKIQNENHLHEIKVKHEIESHRQRLRYAQEVHKAKMQQFIKKNET